MNYKKIIVDALLKRDSGLCPWCGLPSLPDEDVLEFDHIKPRSQGGLDTIINLRLLHSHCHEQRHSQKTNKANETFSRSNIKKKIHTDLLIKLQAALIAQHMLSRAAASIGITFDQARYYLSVYHLDWKNPLKWDLENL
jgi:hypothetical protein